MRIDPSGVHVGLDGESRPATVLRADIAVVLSPASGMLPVEQVVGAGELTGDERDLIAMFGAGR
ncbi:hypothetical protein AB0L57_19565 [Nocardia sp. NPDC052254]|uniref:hypothetical protein n=1 Tax=Nocardia sp. NPDC052254 TaxID=3155681 RepID=UPI003415F33B